MIQLYSGSHLIYEVDYSARYGGRQSEYKPVNYCVPLGSVLRPLLFIIYTAELGSSSAYPHQYADDVQTYGWRLPTESNALRDKLSSCVQVCDLWMQSLIAAEHE